jgi:hypothetical protein
MRALLSSSLSPNLDLPVPMGDPTVTPLGEMSHVRCALSTVLFVVTVGP